MKKKKIIKVANAFLRKSAFITNFKVDSVIRMFDFSNHNSSYDKVYAVDYEAGIRVKVGVIGCVYNAIQSERNRPFRFTNLEPSDSEIKEKESALRDQIAIAAMNAKMNLIANSPVFIDANKMAEEISEDSYKYADAMLKAREK